MRSATVMAWNKLYRRSFLDRCAIHYPPLFHEDIAETPRLFANEPRIEVLDEILYNYVKRVDSASGLSINVRDTDILPVCRLLLECAKEYPLYAAEFEHIVIHRLRDHSAACASRPEEWAIRSLEEAQSLLATLRDKQADNPYFLIESAEHPGVKVAFTRLMSAIRKLFVRRVRAHPRLFLMLERLIFVERKNR